MTKLLIIYAAAALYGAYVFFVAPEGYEDEDGFHEGKQGDTGHE